MTIKKNNQLLEKILSWDLEKIVNYVVLENPELSESDIRKAEVEYKNYIYLTLLTGEFLSIPTRIVDFIWHAHILHTKDYINFCNSVAGGYIHHAPVEYSGQGFEENRHKIEVLSQEVFGNVVFNFDKQKMFGVVNFACDRIE